MKVIKFWKILVACLLYAIGDIWPRGMYTPTLADWNDIKVKCEGHFTFHVLLSFYISFVYEDIKKTFKHIDSPWGASPGVSGISVDYLSIHDSQSNIR